MALVMPSTTHISLTMQVQDYRQTGLFQGEIAMVKMWNVALTGA